MLITFKTQCKGHPNHVNMQGSMAKLSHSVSHSEATALHPGNLIDFCFPIHISFLIFNVIYVGTSYTSELEPFIRGSEEIDSMNHVHKSTPNSIHPFYFHPVSSSETGY